MKDKVLEELNMNTENFEKIIDGLQKRIAACNLRLGFILTTEDLNNLTIQEARTLKYWAKNEQSKMDRIIGTDLYHIIGMGELTVTQMNLFIKLIKEYLSFRSDIKAIASNLTLENIPGLPATSEYILTGFGNIKLVSATRSRGEAASVIDDNK